MARFHLIAGLLLVCVQAVAQGTTSITGSVVKVPGIDGSALKATFSCTGTPTCVGQYVAQEKLPECSNILAY